MKKPISLAITKFKYGQNREKDALKKLIICNDIPNERYVAENGIVHYLKRLGGQVTQMYSLLDYEYKPGKVEEPPQESAGISYIYIKDITPDVSYIYIKGIPPEISYIYIKDIVPEISYIYITDAGTSSEYCRVNDYTTPSKINIELPNFVRIAVTDSYDNINWNTTFTNFSSYGWDDAELSEAVQQVLSDTKMSTGGGGTGMFFVSKYGASGVEGTATTLKSEGCYRYFKPTPPEILSSMPDFIDIVPYMFMEEPDKSQWYISSCGTHYWGGF